MFRKFFADYGSEFEDAPPLESGEHNLKYYSLFQDYLKVYEVRSQGAVEVTFVA